jgi:hypothetical protein
MLKSEIRNLADREKVKLVSYAASEAGHKSVEYSLEHALVFYLKHKRFKFSYNFSARSDLGLLDIANMVDYPWSKALDNDISELASLGYLRLKPGSLYLFWNKKHDDEIPMYITALEQENERYDKMSQIVSEALNNKGHFIRACYKMYLKRM